ncbi:MAG: hypothetical protein RLZZ528_2577 [Pseudomonadota bacterium]
MALEAFKDMATGAMRDKAASFAVSVVAAFLFLTVWVLAVAGVVVLLAERFGLAVALLGTAGGLGMIAVLLVAVTTARNRRAAERRAATRAVWTATAITAVDALIRRAPLPDKADTASGSWVSRTSVLLAGGIALILLALLGRGKGGDDPPPSA